MEMHLQGIPDYKIWKNLTKIRTSTYSFEIEMGRYKKKNGKYIPASDRLCKFCKGNLVEDKQLWVVTIKMLEIFPGLNSKSEEEKFIYLMSTKDVESINITSKYLQDVNKIRGKI